MSKTKKKDDFNLNLKSEIDILNDEGFELKYSNPSLAFDKSKSALEKSEQINYQYGIAKANINLAWLCLIKGELENCISHGKKAVAVYSEIDNDSGMASGYNILSNAYCNMSNYELAVRYAFEASKIYEYLKNEKAAASIFNNIGNIYESIGNYDDALEFYFKSLELKEKFDDKKAIGFTLTNIGLVNISLEDYDKARDYFNRALVIFTKLKNYDSIANILNNLAIISSNEGNPIEAIDKFLEVLKIRKSINDLNGETGVLINLAHNYYLIKNYKKAKECIDICLHNLEKLKNSEFKARSLVILGNIYTKEGNSETASVYFQEALKISTEIKNDNLKNNVLISQYKFYEETGDFKKALETYKLHFELTQKLVNEDIKLKNKNLELKYEINKFKEELDTNEKEKQKLSEALKKVETLNRKLTDMDRDKNEIIGIVAHDMRNPVSTVIMVTRNLLEDFDNFTKEEIKSDIADLNSTSEKMLKLLNNILNLNAIETGKINFKFKEFDIVKISKETFFGFKTHSNIKNINLHFHSDLNEALVNLDVDSYIQIIENIISNAIKYTTKNKNVYMNITESENNVKISIKDEGEGIKNEDIQKLFKKYQRLNSIPTGGESSNGLGLSIAKRFTEEMGGKIYCESEYGKGAEFILEFPIVEKK
ncbi:MAG TPA: tetratricopeptide repeat-containing sensor histidine kinase [Ignavibacteria bacterium]|nr:tetratricopeptide repeat-containing sensor histidine kinase [Ignavibacteria bacterium]